jgi:hypothetical protein
MAKYPQVPEWWYGIIFRAFLSLSSCCALSHLLPLSCSSMSMFVFSIIVIEVWPTGMPVWVFVLALIIVSVYIILTGMNQAITNQQVGLNVGTELAIGSTLSNKPKAMTTMSRTWGYITIVQALRFMGDFKLGHYMKTLCMFPHSHPFN